MRPNLRLRFAALYLFIMGTSSLAYTIAELLMGLMYQSLLITSDALHGFMDSAIAYVAGIGLYYASRESKPFPWEIYRLESLLTLASVLAVLGLYTYTLATSLRLEGKPTPLWLISIVLLGAALTYIMYPWERENYKALKLEILRADSIHAKADTALLLAAASSIAVSNAFDLYIAEIAAIIAVYSYAAVECFKLVRDSLNGLMGALYRDAALEEK